MAGRTVRRAGERAARPARAEGPNDLRRARRAERHDSIRGERRAGVVGGDLLSQGLRVVAGLEVRDAEAVCAARDHPRSIRPLAARRRQGRQYQRPDASNGEGVIIGPTVARDRRERVL